ncbi:hypothetical protein BROUX41_001465 [Berkeleyomyces rouxiae]|uniref:uncharacterized protein n=1 Tax=Berkeleyomyces rouxiae TaxID=2035830 RepID=UPI003B7F2936
MSSFGSPGGGKLTTKPTPPERGSFPLDHDGECKSIMKEYLGCLQNVRGMNDERCRQLAKGYLACRMDRNLMARDDFKNLGFTDATNNGSTATSAPKEAAKTLDAGSKAVAAPNLSNTSS